MTNTRRELLCTVSVALAILIVCAASSISAACDGFDVFPGGNLEPRTGNIRSVPGITTAEQCCAECTYEPLCTGWVFGAEDWEGRCWIKSIGLTDSVVYLNDGSEAAGKKRAPEQPNNGGCSGFLVLPNIDYQGASLSHYENVQSTTACCDLCKSYEQNGQVCSYWLYYDLGRMCQLKAKTNAPGDGTPYELLVRGTTSGKAMEAAAKPCGRFDVLQGRNLWGGDIAMPSAATARECCLQCNKYPGCVAWTFGNWPGPQCYLKDASHEAPSERGDGATSGVLKV